jgi:hypothetical protein
MKLNIALIILLAAVTLKGQWSSGPISLPSGALILKISGTCPQGSTENSSLSGKTLVGTTVANGNVGTSAGSDTITPTGTISALTTGADSNTTGGVAKAIAQTPVFTGAQFDNRQAFTRVIICSIN